MDGDSAFLTPPLVGQGALDLGGLRPTILDVPYFFGVKEDDPLVSPVLHPSVLKDFPPVLLIASTRDFAMSSVLNQNNKLAAAGVDTRLFVWDGLWHGFFLDVSLPESQEVFDIVADFFDSQLGF